MYPEKNPFSRLDACPPWLMHALATSDQRGGPRCRPPLLEIVQRSKLTERTYLRTIGNDDWENVKKSVIAGVMIGTRVNPWNMRNHWRYLRKHNFKIPTLNSRQQRILDEMASRMLQSGEGARE